jgi:hypothetical protein
MAMMNAPYGFEKNEENGFPQGGRKRTCPSLLAIILPWRKAVNRIVEMIDFWKIFDRDRMGGWRRLHGIQAFCRFWKGR